MKYSHAIRFFLVLSLAVYASACSGRPTEMINLTEKVKQEAADEHADQFAPEEWGAAEQDYREASAKLDAQKWGEASALLLRAKGHYTKARDLAKQKRELAIKEINGIHQLASNRCKQWLKDDPAVKKLSGARKKDFDAAVQQIEDNLAKVADLLKNGQYSESKVLAQRMNREVYDVQQEYLKK